MRWNTELTQKEKTRALFTIDALKAEDVNRLDADMHTVGPIGLFSDSEWIRRDLELGMKGSATELQQMQEKYRPKPQPPRQELRTSPGGKPAKKIYGTDTVMIADEAASEMMDFLQTEQQVQGVLGSGWLQSRRFVVEGGFIVNGSAGGSVSLTLPFTEGRKPGVSAGGAHSFGASMGIYRLLSDVPKDIWDHPDTKINYSIGGSIAPNIEGGPSPVFSRYRTEIIGPYGERYDAMLEIVGIGAGVSLPATFSAETGF